MGFLFVLSDRGERKAFLFGLRGFSASPSVEVASVNPHHSDDLGRKENTFGENSPTLMSSSEYEKCKVKVE